MIVKKNGTKKIIALFGYPIDNSVRSQVFSSMEEVLSYYKRWKDICYLIVSFESAGNIITYDSINPPTTREKEER